MEQPPLSRGLSAREYFAEAPTGALTAAHLATGIAYSTVHRASKGDGVNLKTARELEKWSRGLNGPTYISALATLGVHDPSSDPEPVEVLHDANAAAVEGAA